jgi:hypothetical protein
LRSATTSSTVEEIVSAKSTVVVQSESSAFESVASANPEPQTPSKQSEHLKQQTLLDLFKQRKRRNSSCMSSVTNFSGMIKQQQSQSASKLKANHTGTSLFSAPHYLRSMATMNH